MRIQSVVDVITTDLRHKIIRGVLASGQRIKKIDIAARYQQTAYPRVIRDP